MWRIKSSLMLIVVLHPGSHSVLAGWSRTSTTHPHHVWFTAKKRSQSLLPRNCFLREPIRWSVWALSTRWFKKADAIRQHSELLKETSWVISSDVKGCWHHFHFLVDNFFFQSDFVNTIQMLCVFSIHKLQYKHSQASCSCCDLGTTSRIDLSMSWPWPGSVY